MLDQHFGCVTEPCLCLARLKPSLSQKALCPTAPDCFKVNQVVSWFSSNLERL
jgi:hypothetical protein